MIYTSYFGKLNKLPKDVIPVAICGKAPDWYLGKQYKKLAPKYWFFKEWKETHDNEFYVKHFNKEVLSVLDPHRVVKELEELAGSKKLALICYEKPGDFCHRTLVSKWLNENGIEVKEFENKK